MSEEREIHGRHHGHRSLEQRVNQLEDERKRDDNWQKRAEGRLNALEQHAGGGGAELIAGAIDRLTAAMSRPSTSNGHFTMHVTAVETNKEDSMPPVDHMPPLELPSSSVRAKLAVVGPKNASGSYLTSVTWTLSEETEPGALVLEAIPDDVAKDENGNPVLDEQGNQIPVFSTYANTPLEPAEGEKAGGLVTVAGAGMANADKRVTYGNPALGHFSIIGVEAPEV